MTDLTFLSDYELDSIVNKVTRILLSDGFMCFFEFDTTGINVSLFDDEEEKIEVFGYNVKFDINTGKIYENVELSTDDGDVFDMSYDNMDENIKAVIDNALPALVELGRRYFASLQRA